MEISIYGVRGSIPVAGQSTHRYGGNSVCVAVTLADDTLVVLDSGSGLRELGKELLGRPYKRPLHLLLSHMHWDHIIGLPFFLPFYRPDTHVLAWPLPTEEQQEARRRRRMIDGLHFPVRASDLPARIETVENTDPVWHIGSAEVRRILLNHPGVAQGFRIDDGDGRSLVYITDHELFAAAPALTSFDAVVEFCAGADVLIHEAQYVAEDLPQKRGRGHSSVDEVLQLGARARPGRLVLFHHDPDRDDDMLDAIAAQTAEWLAVHAPGVIGLVAHEGMKLTL